MREQETVAITPLRLPGAGAAPGSQPTAVSPPVATAYEPLILLAEDDEDIVELVSFRLERSGYRVARAHDGAEAVDLVQELRPDLAVFDISMPVMNGLDAIKALRADPLTASVPIILLTARVTPGDIAAGIEAGATAYVTKPFSPQDLSRRIAGVLGDA